MKFIITGGSGYIGSNLIWQIFKKYKQARILVIDDLKRGNNQNKLIELFEEKLQIINLDLSKEIPIIPEFYSDAVVFHLAALAYVGESVQIPDVYLGRNIAACFNLVKALATCKPRKVIFSSSCAVYGDTKVVLKEDSPCLPVNPYGLSKLYSEKLLNLYIPEDIPVVSLRYFNVAGAVPECPLGERHSPETHIIPKFTDSLQEHSVIEIFGNDYDTIDGTCMREYIHVLDLVEAHLQIATTDQLNSREVFNLSSDVCVSNLQIVQQLESILGIKAKVKFKPRRLGDPAVLRSNYEKIHNFVGWRPKYNDLSDILISYLEWKNNWG